MPTVLEILRDGLKAKGFDGLVSTDGECGCLAEDLAPCESDCSRCVPGYRGKNLDQAYSPDEWAIFSSKEAVEASMSDAGAKQGAQP